MGGGAESGPDPTGVRRAALGAEVTAEVCWVDGEVVLSLAGEGEGLRLRFWFWTSSRADCRLS